MKKQHIFLTCAFLFSAWACQDEEIMPTPSYELLSRGITVTSTATSALTSADGGKTWTTTRRVPLVGEGRIVDDMSNALIEVLTNNQGIANILDTDITNYASFNGVATTNLIGNQIASVRDVNRTYAGGQNAGFVYLLSDASLLTLDVLKGFYLKTYLKGVEQEMKGSDTQQVQTLQLNLIGAANNGGQQALSLTTSLSKPFDEIKIGMYGISATVLNALKLYYAFVGDNPIQPAVTGNTYFTNGVAVHGDPILASTWTNMVSSGELIDSNLTNGPSFSLLGSLTQPRATIDFKKTIPIGAEVGFNLSNLSLLNLNLLGTTILTTYDASDVPQEQVTVSNLLGISAIVGGGNQISMILKKPCTQLKIQFAGINVNLGATVVNYAYVRDATVVDASSFFSLANATITGQSYQFATPAVGNVSYTITGSPTGSTPTISNNKMTGMTVNGNYTVSGTYVSADGTSYTQTAVITRTTADASPCLQLLTPSTYGASINYAATRSVGVVNVGTSFNNLGNLIDADMNSYTLITTTNVLGAVTVAVKFNKIQQKQPVGFAVIIPPSILEAELISWVTLTVYNSGTEVGRTGTGGLLDLNVLSSGTKAYIETTPQSAPFDEVRITFSGVVDALKVLQLVGVYTRADDNGNGIPDCAETPSGGGDPISVLGVTAHVCQGSPVVIRVQGGTNSGTYLLRCYNAANNNAVTDKTVVLSNQQFTLPNMPAGDYYISIYDAPGTNIYYNGIHATIHPLRTTWKTNATSTDWNTWSNWSDGSPWQCTDVIIPSDAIRYPVLASGSANYCNNLHFAPHAEIVNTHYLTYGQAWAEMALQAGRYYMLSAPLKSTFTGDMFVPAAMNGTQNNDYFATLNTTTSPESRFSPRVYQRLWSHDAPGQKLTGGSLTTVTVVPDKTNWTPPFNALNQLYTLGMGFSLLADKESSTASTLTFRFPKEHTQYTYYTMSGQGTSYTETLTRSLTGRFIYEGSNGSASFPITVNTTNKTSSNTFLVGNPFMTHIRIDQFMADNPSVTSVKVYDGNSNNSIIKANGQLLSNGSNWQYIAPMQSFFVTVSNPSVNLSVQFTQTALTQAPGNGGWVRSSVRSAAFSSATVSRSIHPTLLLTATVGDVASQCIVRLNLQADNAFRTHEDSELLTDNEVPPTIAIFSIAEEKALDIQQLNNAVNRIPLGFSLRTPARVTLRLSHASGNSWSEWSLVDTQTGRRTSLSASEVTLDVGILSTHVARFYLEKN